MREIKFRAWNCETKQFDPCFYFLTEGDGITNKIIGIEDDNWNEQLIEDGAVILQQYTGLKDKNGREIYEGDILRFRTGTLGIVTYQEQGFIWQSTPQDLHNPGGHFAGKWQADFEVVGNFFENPELLETGGDAP
jgi:hypothetical protein